MNRLKLLKFGLNVIKRIAYPEISRINFALTWRCNHRCVSCHIWQHQQSQTEDITADDMEKILSRNRPIWLTLNGGEPSLNRDFKDILTICLDRVPLVNVVSNGQIPELLVQPIDYALSHTGKGLLVVHLSLFGSSEIHDKMAGIPFAHARVIDSMAALKKIKSNRLHLGFEHMLSSHNRGQHKYVTSIADHLGVGITYVIEERAGFYHNDKEIIDRVEIPPIRFRLNPLDVFRNGFLYRYRNQKPMKCVAGQYSCLILPDQNVYSCFFLVPDEPAFNLRNTDYRLDRELFSRNSQWIASCRGCWALCETYTTSLFRPWRLIK